MKGSLTYCGRYPVVGCDADFEKFVDDAADFFVAVGAHICRTVVIENRTWIGAVISNNTSICSTCTIGAGAVVVRDIEVPGTYIGVPARRRG